MPESKRFDVIFEGKGVASGKMRNDISVQWPAMKESFDLATDEGPFHGGDGTAPPPLALFTAALTGCIMTQIRAFSKRLKINIGTAYPDDEARTMHVKGRDLVAGIPKTIEIHSEEIREAISEPVNTIVETVRIALEKTPPELAADIVDKGIVLAGGGALIKNLDILLREETGLPIMVAEDPLVSAPC